MQHFLVKHLRSGTPGSQREHRGVGTKLGNWAEWGCNDSIQEIVPLAFGSGTLPGWIGEGKGTSTGRKVRLHTSAAQKNPVLNALKQKKHLYFPTQGGTPHSFLSLPMEQMVHAKPEASHGEEEDIPFIFSTTLFGPTSKVLRLTNSGASRIRAAF